MVSYLSLHSKQLLFLFVTTWQPYFLVKVFTQPFTTVFIHLCFFQMIKVFLGLLASSALSKGMFINNKTDNGNFTPPPPGSPDRPIPSEYWGTGGYPPLPDNQLPKHDYSMMDGGPQQIRTGFLMPYEIPNGMPVPTENYPMLPKGYPLPPNSGVNSQGSRMFDMPDLTYCNMILEAPVPPTADQVPWFCTCTLCKGTNSAPKGERGDRGLPGNYAVYIFLWQGFAKSWESTALNSLRFPCSQHSTLNWIKRVGIKGLFRVIRDNIEEIFVMTLH